MLNILEKFVVSKGYTYFRLDGSTPVASRQGLIKKFNEVKVESVVVVIWRSFTAVNRELKDDVTRDDSQQRFLAQHSITELLWHCFEWLQHCSNIATLCCAENRRCKSSRVTSPLSNDDNNENVKKQLVLWAKQLLCTCITLFSTFPWRPLHDYDVNPPNATFFGGREHTKKNFPLFEPE